MDLFPDSLATAGPRSVSRRAFLKFCTITASLLALPPGSATLLAGALTRPRRLPVVWLSFQECTGCTESLTRSSAPSFERLLFEMISLDYHHTLQAASGMAAEQAREAVLKEHAGKLLLVIDGSVPTALGGACSTIAGEDNLSLLRRCMEAAEAVLALGTCAAFGGLPAASPNPTGAMGIAELMQRGKVPRRPLVNLPGCPPIPEVISAVLAREHEAEPTAITQAQPVVPAFPPRQSIETPLGLPQCRQLVGSLVHAGRQSGQGFAHAGKPLAVVETQVAAAPLVVVDGER